MDADSVDFRMHVNRMTGHESAAEKRKCLRDGNMFVRLRDMTRFSFYFSDLCVNVQLVRGL